jgi:uncharacterized integral membrane protein (TIGR00697 family)
MNSPAADRSARAYRFLTPIGGLFVAVLVVSNIASVKLVRFGPLSFDGGTILFPLSYIFGDILTEVYGYARSRMVIWTGFVAATIAAVVLAAVDALPAAAGWELPGLPDPSASFHALLGQVPRIVLGSLLAYWAGEFSNSYVLAKMKLITRGRWLWTRTIGSTLVGEGVDTTAFILIAFLGLYQPRVLGILILSNYLFKVSVEVVFTPLTYLIVASLKRAENEDYYDWRTRFNPFLLRLD